MSQIETFRYDDEIVRKFLLATIVWGVVGLLLGVIIATQLVFWETNLGPWFSFGRLRPLHTNAVIFAFVGNGMFAGIYHSMQRLCKARMFSDALSNINFWGWQLIIVAAAVTLPLGITVSKEYAELEWPIDIAITLVWVVFAINFFGTLLVRRERHIYVAIWFYMATVITVALLHIVNSLELPVTFLKSYSIYAGVQDALVQWWYGHNAVAFFLTTPILGLMYYYMPKVANRPVYSYRLSVIHFWALIFLYIWAGPHHLLYTALPDWAQTLGMVFSLMLIAPSWGGMINGLMTLRGAWEKLRTDPVLKFLVVAIPSNPSMWTRHSGAFRLMNFALIYFLVPRLWKEFTVNDLRIGIIDVSGIKSDSEVFEGYNFAKTPSPVTGGSGFTPLELEGGIRFGNPHDDPLAGQVPGYLALPSYGKSPIHLHFPDQGDAFPDRHAGRSDTWAGTAAEFP